MANEVYENQLRFKFYEARINQPVPDSLEILERDYKPHSITNVEMYPGGWIKSVHCGVFLGLLLDSTTIHKYEKKQFGYALIEH